MQVSIHNITSINVEQTRYWAGKECEFYLLSLEMCTDDSTQSIKLFSSKPMTLVNPEIKVAD